MNQQAKLKNGYSTTCQFLMGIELFPSNKRKLLLSIISLIFLCVLVYSPVFSHQFQTLWDDQWVVINHYTEGGFDPVNLWNVITEFYYGQYSPINELYYILLYSVFGYNPFWFHTASLLVHIVNTLLVYFFLNKLLAQTRFFQTLSIRRIAFFTALLMAIHPFLVEAVAWLTASRILLYSLFYLIALHFYLSYTATYKLKYYLLTILFFIISFGAKEQAVTLPACLLLLDYVLKRNFKSKNVWLEKLPFFVLSIFFGIVTMFSQAAAGEGVLSGEATYPFYQNIVFASYTVIEYLVKCLVPLKLSYLYPFPNPAGEPVPIRFWIYPFIILFATLFLWNFWKQRWIFFGIAFFLIHIALVSNIISLSRYAIVADRYVYIASIGVFFTIAYFLDKLIMEKTKYWKIVVTIFLLYAVTLGTYTYQRSKVWHDTDTLKEEIRSLLKQRNDFKELQNKYQ